MNRIWSVARNTFIEAVRDRVLYSLILFAFLMILSSLILASISAEQYNKIVKDLGLTVISLIGIMISVFLGMGLVYKEIEKKTVYNIFSKPIRRYEFILGKYLGLAFTILVNTLAMAFILFIIVFYIESKYGEFVKFYYGGHYFAEFFKAVYFEYLEFLIVVGIALVFSSFTTPVMTVLLTFLLFAVGRFSSDVRLFAEEVKTPVTGVLAELIYRVIPNLEKFDVRREAVYGGNVSLELILYTTAYA
ncbi:MAG: ABC transporter permease, partial [Thermodesulfobacteriota bacterium]